MNCLSLSNAQLNEEYARLSATYAAMKAEGLKLDLSRGKPSPEQLALCEDMLTAVTDGADTRSVSGMDCRNYGELCGIPEARAFFASYTGIPAENIIVGGNSSLNLMYDALTRCMIFGTVGSPRPWCHEQGLKFLCPAPGSCCGCFCPQKMVTDHGSLVCSVFSYACMSHVDSFP